MRIGVRGWWEGGRTYAPVVCSRDVSYVHGFIFLLDSQAIYLKLSAVPSRGAKRPQILLRASRSSQHSRGFILFSENRTCFPRALRCAKQERQATANTVPRSFQEGQATSARHVRRRRRNIGWRQAAGWIAPRKKIRRSVPPPHSDIAMHSKK